MFFLAVTTYPAAEDEFTIQILFYILFIYFS